MCFSFRRQTFVTPKSLLSFLESYKILYKEKYDNIQMLAVRMQAGLHKLVEAASSVGLLKTELIEKVFISLNHSSISVFTNNIFFYRINSL